MGLSHSTLTPFVIVSASTPIINVTGRTTCLLLGLVLEHLLRQPKRLYPHRLRQSLLGSLALTTLPLVITDVFNVGLLVVTVALLAKLNPYPGL